MTDMPDAPDNSAMPHSNGVVIDAPDLAGDWLPPAAAAARLGISERTLWRHVDQGRYHKRIVAGRAEVLVPTSAPSTPPDAPDSAAIELRTPPALALALVDEIKRHHDELLPLLDRLTTDRDVMGKKLIDQATELGRLQAEKDELQRRIDAQALELGATIKGRDQLATELGSVAQQLAESEANLAALKQPIVAPRPWWKVW